MNLLAGYSLSVCLFLGVLFKSGSVGWVLGERGECMGCSTCAEDVELSETQTPSAVVKMRDVSAVDCRAGLWPFTLPDISPLARGAETGRSGAGSVRVVLVTQVCLCGVYPITVCCQSQSSLGCSAATLRHLPRGRQHAPSQ